MEEIITEVLKDLNLPATTFPTGQDIISLKYNKAYNPFCKTWGTPKLNQAGNGVSALTFPLMHPSIPKRTTGYVDIPHAHQSSLLTAGLEWMKANYPQLSEQDFCVLPDKIEIYSREMKVPLGVEYLTEPNWVAVISQSSPFKINGTTVSSFIGTKVQVFSGMSDAPIFITQIIGETLNLNRTPVELFYGLEKVLSDPKYMRFNRNFSHDLIERRMRHLLSVIQEGVPPVLKKTIAQKMNGLIADAMSSLYAVDNETECPQF